MLALTRRSGERIRLRLPDGSDVWITFEDRNHSNRAKILIDAPSNIIISREELLPRSKG